MWHKLLLRNRSGRRGCADFCMPPPLAPLLTWHRSQGQTDMPSRSLMQCIKPEFCRRTLVSIDRRQTCYCQMRSSRAIRILINLQQEATRHWLQEIRCWKHMGGQGGKEFDLCHALSAPALQALCVLPVIRFCMLSRLPLLYMHCMVAETLSLRGQQLKKQMCKINDAPWGEVLTVGSQYCLTVHTCPRNGMRSNSFLARQSCIHAQ